MKLQAKTAADLMTRGPYSISADSTPNHAAEFLIEKGFGAAVVIDNAGHPLGVITKTDLLVHLRAEANDGPSHATVKDVMTPTVFSISRETPAETVVRQFVSLSVHHLFVLDDNGVVVGVISPLDVISRLG